MAVTSWGLTMNIVNSIVGVSVLTMPYCFKECGVVLGTALLLFCAWMTHQTCMMLVKTAFATKRRTYVGLAYQAYGHPGKLLVEASMIGLMLGTCIAFYVVIADLGSSFFGRLLGVTVSFGFRALLLLAVASLIVLPISLQRNLMASLQALSAMALLFYAFFVLVMACLCFSHEILTEQWRRKLGLSHWGTGLFHSFSIFSMAFGCQSQVLPTYDSLDEPSVKHMSAIFGRALKIVYTFYIAVGFFGYASFTEEIAGNVLMNFPSNLVTEAIRVGFVLSVAVSFPMMILPCRQALNTLLFETQQKDGTFTATGFMPPLRFKVVTALIVFSTMLVSVFVPNVETILGLTGATMGSLICFICPALIYRRLHKDGFIAQLVLWVGLVVLVVSTISTLSPASPEKVAATPSLMPHRSLNLDAVLVPEVRAPNRDLGLDLGAAPDDALPVVNGVMGAREAGGGRVRLDSMEEGAAEPPQIEVPKPEAEDKLEDEQGQLLRPDDGRQQALQDEHRHEPPVPRDGVPLDRPGNPVLQEEVLEVEGVQEVRHEEVVLRDEHRKEQINAVEEHEEIFPDDKPVPGGGGRVGGHDGRHDGGKLEVHEHVVGAAVKMEEAAAERRRADANDHRELAHEEEKEKAPPALPHPAEPEVGGHAAIADDNQPKEQAEPKKLERAEAGKDVPRRARDEARAGANNTHAAAAPPKHADPIEPNAPAAPAAVAAGPGDGRPPAEHDKDAPAADAAPRGGDEEQKEKSQEKPQQGQAPAGADAGAGPAEGEDKLDQNLLLEVIKEQQEQQKRLLDQQERLLAVIQEQHKEMHGQEKADSAARPHSQPAPKNADSNEDVQDKRREGEGGADTAVKPAQAVDNGDGADELLRAAAQPVVLREEKLAWPAAGAPADKPHRRDAADPRKASHGDGVVAQAAKDAEAVMREEPATDRRKRAGHADAPRPAHHAAPTALDKPADPPAPREEKEGKADALRDEGREDGNAVAAEAPALRAEVDDAEQKEKADSLDLRRKRKKRESGNLADSEAGTLVGSPGPDGLLRGRESPARMQVAPLSSLMRKLKQAAEPDAG